MIRGRAVVLGLERMRSAAGPAVQLGRDIAHGGLRGGEGRDLGIQPGADNQKLAALAGTHDEQDFVVPHFARGQEIIGAHASEIDAVVIVGVAFIELATPE
jgi:hypothetical protein